MRTELELSKTATADDARALAEALPQVREKKEKLIMIIFGYCIKLTPFGYVSNEVELQGTLEVLLLSTLVVLVIRFASCGSHPFLFQVIPARIGCAAVHMHAGTRILISTLACKGSHLVGLILVFCSASFRFGVVFYPDS